MRKLIDIVNEDRTSLDSDWLNSEKPVKTNDGRPAIVTSIDMSEEPNIIKGKVKMKEELFDYEWLQDGTCKKAVDQNGNPKQPDDADKLIKDL